MCVSSRQELGDRESRGPECCPAPYLMVEPCLLPFGNNMPQISRKQEEYSRTGIFPSQADPDYHKKHQQFVDRQVDIMKIHALLYTVRSKTTDDRRRWHDEYKRGNRNDRTLVECVNNVFP